MAAILCIETTTTNCSVALSIDGSVTSLLEDHSKTYSHSERLHPYIQDVLRKADLSPEKLDAIAVSQGPGSYTGLRIGVSAAKGLCYALDLPLIAIPTLEALTYRVNEETDWIIPMLDARRMEVYCALFDGTKKRHGVTQAKVLEENSFNSTLEMGVTFFIGNGVSKFQELCTHPNARFLENELPSATEMAPIAEARYLSQSFEDVAYFEPYYLKDFITTVKRS